MSHRSFLELVNVGDLASLEIVHPWKLTRHWKIPMFNRKHIFKWWMFHCHVGFPGGWYHHKGLAHWQAKLLVAWCTCHSEKFSLSMCWKQLNPYTPHLCMYVNIHTTPFWKFTPHLCLAKKIYLHPSFIHFGPWKKQMDLKNPLSLQTTPALIWVLPTLVKMCCMPCMQLGISMTT